jgi:hypothetical protein
MKRTLSVIVSIILTIVCYKLNQKELALAIGMYVSGCVSMYLFQLFFRKYETGFETDFEQDAEYNSYKDFIESSSDELWNEFVNDTNFDEDFTTLSDDREMFYCENIEKYSHKLDVELKQNSANLSKIIGTNL